MFLCAQLQYTPFGALQVRPVTQEVREEAVEFCHVRPREKNQTVELADIFFC